MDGSSKQFIPAIRQAFPHVYLQGKGLLATEGSISLPISNHGSLGSPLAFTSHFLEFGDLNDIKKTSLAHELEKGKSYTPIITTESGLYRYHLQILSNASTQQD